MKRLDRALGILLVLRSQRTVSAQALAERFEVSTRTIYRDVDILGELGIPVYAEMGRNGGFRLMDSYFMPPVTFNFGEAMSAILGLAFLQSMRVRPFPRDLETAQQKLISAMPEAIRRQLIESERILGSRSLVSGRRSQRWSHTPHAAQRSGAPLAHRCAARRHGAALRCAQSPRPAVAQIRHEPLDA